MKVRFDIDYETDGRVFPAGCVIETDEPTANRLVFKEKVGKIVPDEIRSRLSVTETVSDTQCAPAPETPQKVTNKKE